MGQSGMYHQCDKPAGSEINYGLCECVKLFFYSVTIKILYKVLTKRNKELSSESIIIFLGTRNQLKTLSLTAMILFFD